jgi:acetamidase/formamidase
MRETDPGLQFESLKSGFLDGRLSREEFLAESGRLGMGTAAYAWLNTPAEATSGEPLVGGTVEAPPVSDGEIQRLAEEARIVSFVPTEDQFAWTFGGVAPVLHVKPGQVLKLWSEDAFAGRIRTVEDLPSRVLEYPFINPQTGPFYVEGAEPGDTLAIHLIDMEAASTQAASTTIPLFGSLTATVYTQLLNPALPEIVWIYQVDPARRTVLYQARESDHQVEIPLRPFLGTIGVAPKAMEARNVLVPEAFGGNMDTPEARTGTTLYFGVNVPGGLFSIGDGHYAQSEGEVCGVAVEGPMHTSLAVEVLKGTYVEWPRLENDEYIMAAGSYRPLEDAFRIAFTQMVRWMASDFGLSTMDAYQLVTQVAETHVANVVDTNYTILAKVPKRYLPRRASIMGGAHARLRKFALALGDRGSVERS